MSRLLNSQSIEKSRLDYAGKLSIYTFLSLLLLQCLLCVFSKNRGSCSFAIWFNISYLQVIHWINFINIDADSEFEAFFTEFSVIFRPFKLGSVCSDEEIQESSYKAVKISSNGFINNAKELLIVYGTVLFLCFVAFVGYYKLKIEFFERFIKLIKYSVIIRLHLLVLLDFMVFSMINIKFFSGNSECSSINLVFAIVFLIIAGGFVLIIPMIFKRMITTDLETHIDTLFQPFETLFGEFVSTSNIIKLQYYSIYIIYRLVLSFSLVYLSYSPTVQLFMITTFQVLMRNSYTVLYILKIDPYKHKSDKITAIISESLTLALFILFFVRYMSLGDAANYYISVFSILIIWATEICIMIRFIFAFKRSEPLNEATQALPSSETSKNIESEKNEKFADKTKVRDDERSQELNEVIARNNSSVSYLSNNKSQTRKFNLNEFTVKASNNNSALVSRQLHMNQTRNRLDTDEPKTLFYKLEKKSNN